MGVHVCKHMYVFVRAWVSVFCVRNLAVKKSEVEMRERSSNPGTSGAQDDHCAVSLPLFVPPDAAPPCA